MPRLVRAACLNIKTFGTFLPPRIFGLWQLVCSTIRLTYLVIAAYLTGMLTGRKFLEVLPLTFECDLTERGLLVCKTSVLF